MEPTAIPVIEVGVIVVTALFLGLVFSRLKQATTIGYIIAGVVLGPLLLNFLIPGQGIAPVFAEIGLLMLMFYLGLELSFKRFREFGGVATILVFSELIVFFTLGFAAAKFFGFSDLEAIVVGSMLPFVSTAIVTKFIFDKGLTQTIEGRTAISALIIEDFVSIIILVFFSSTSGQSSVNITVLTALFFVIAAFFVVSRLSNRVLSVLSKFGHADKMALYAIGLGILVAYFGAFLGLSPILGAYFAGFALAETVYGERIKKELGFFREFFILFFFVSFGSSLSVPHSYAVLWLLIALVVLHLILKIVLYGILGNALGMTQESAVTTGVLMTSTGEFSIIIAGAAAPLVARGPDLLALALMLAVVNISIGPTLFNNRKKIAALFARLYPKRLQQTLSFFGARVSEVERLSKDKVFQNEYAVALRNLLANIVIALAIVYLSYAVTATAVIPFFGQVSIGLIVLVLIIWPVYKFIGELRFLVKKIVDAMLFASVPALKKRSEIGRAASNIFTGIILTAAGAGATVFFYYKHADPLLLLLPAAYTLLAIMYLSKSFYALFENYELARELVETAGEDRRALTGTRVLKPALEFGEYAQKFRDIHAQRITAREQIQEALQAGDVPRARSILGEYKKKETRALMRLVADYRELKKAGGEEERRLKAIEEEQEHARRALLDYFKKNPPKFKKLKEAGKLSPAKKNKKR